MIGLPIGVLMATGACTMREPPKLIFKTDLTASQMDRAEKECEYEAEKATAMQKPGYGALTWRRIYLMCLELKGATLVGTADDVPAQRVVPRS